MSSTATIALLPGDGVGPEIMAEAQKVLAAIGQRYGHVFETFTALIGGAAIDAHGVPLRSEDTERCRAADAVLLGAVGGPKWDNPNAKIRPEQGLLAIRKGLGLYANLRPVAVMDALADASPLKPEIMRGVDILVVRELTGGLYFGRPSRQWRERRGRAAVDTLVYREHEIVRIARLAFTLARDRRRSVVSVDKANVLSSSRLWRMILSEIAREFPDVTLEHQLVDAAAMALIRNPGRYDVIVTENMFGDILTDEASVLAGSIGLLPSASLGHPAASGRLMGLYEPIHGSAPDIAGQGRVNPIGMVLSVAALLRTSVGLSTEAATIEDAVRSTVEAGIRTADIRDANHEVVTTSSMGDAVASRILGS